MTSLFSACRREDTRPSSKNIPTDSSGEKSHTKGGKNRCSFIIPIAHHLGDNCIQNFHFGEVYRRKYGAKFSFTATRERSCKT